MKSAYAVSNVLDYWIGPDRFDPPPEVRQRWWVKSLALDAEVRDRFGALYEAAVRGELDGWASAPEPSVALLILLDQFSRNLHRDHPRAFRHDLKAQRIAFDVIERQQDLRVAPAERLFLYMPLMHAEDLKCQETCKQAFERLCADVPPSLREGYATNLDFAVRHMEIIERFGRFPHRNAVVGRPSSGEEREFLTTPGSSF